MGQKSPQRSRKLRHIPPIPCPNCGQEVEPAALMQPEGLCPPCWHKAWQAHQLYRKDQAILIAEADPCVWTEDLFGSELIVEQDGCYLQKVRWTDCDSHQPHQAEQIECFDAQTWQGLLAEAQALQACYELANGSFDDFESQSIWLRVDDELVEMRSHQRWQEQPQSARFRAFWNRLHSKSSWLERLQIS